jgi:tRNA pseudouridine38-40 synthase
VANIDLDRELTPVTLREALNFHMKPRRVVVLDAAIVGPDWNARFAAIGRAYRYRVLNRRARAALLADHVWHVQKPLDAAAMHDAAQILVGRHDFTSFRAAACQARTPWRTVDRIDVTRDHDVIEMAIEARSFLHHMVRNIMGTLKLVGEGRWPPERVAEILAAQDRGVAGPTAPSTGLALVAVSYPTDPFST